MRCRGGLAQGAVSQVPEITPPQRPVASERWGRPAGFGLSLLVHMAMVGLLLTGGELLRGNSLGTVAVAKVTLVSISEFGALDAKKPTLVNVSAPLPVERVVRNDPSPAPPSVQPPQPTSVSALTALVPEAPERAASNPILSSSEPAAAQLAFETPELSSAPTVPLESPAPPELPAEPEQPPSPQSPPPPESPPIPRPETEPEPQLPPEPESPVPPSLPSAPLPPPPPVHGLALETKTDPETDTSRETIEVLEMVLAQDFQEKSLPVLGTQEDSLNLIANLTQKVELNQEPRKLDQRSGKLSEREYTYMQDRLAGCWNTITISGANDAAKLKIVVSVTLSTDGSVAEEPFLIEPQTLPTAAHLQAFYEASRAVLECAPYGGLSVDNFKNWRKIELEFDPEGIILQ